METTLFIIGLTTLTTLLAWHTPAWQDLLIGHPYKAYHYHEWYRCLTQALIHADIRHLIFNMYTLYSFGRYVEIIYKSLFGTKSTALYLGLYLGGVLIPALLDTLLFYNKFYFRSLGASAGISAILISAILFNPSAKILFYGMLPISGWLYALIYLLASYYMIGGASSTHHLAHLAGGLYGGIFTLIMYPDLFFRYLSYIKTLLKL